MNWNVNKKSAARLAIAALLLSACTRTDGGGSNGSSATTGNAASPAKTAISVKGSDTMVLLGQRWAESFMKENPGTTIQVSGGGSGTGIAALINGTTDICESSRPMKDVEKENLKSKRGAAANEFKVALDALAVYVNEKNPITEISIPTLAKLYRGEVKNWKDVGGKDHIIVLYGRENNSGTYGYFKEHVLENKDFAASTQTLAGTSAVVNAVKGDEFGIGYGGIAYMGGVRAIKVKKDDKEIGLLPSLEAAQKGTYPLSRFLYFYTAGTPEGTTKKFIDWVASAPGQAVIERVGYYPLPH